jgi:hypothetical protein
MGRTIITSLPTEKPNPIYLLAGLRSYLWIVKVVGS